MQALLFAFKTFSDVLEGSSLFKSQSININIDLAYSEGHLESGGLV